jgi:Fic family protein
MRLLKEMHNELMTGVSGEHLTPGELRRSQNWIGAPGCTLNAAKFVPPPPEEMNDALSGLEKYIHAPSVLPLVVRLALIHYQFEAIHPFLDGNGRIGRLLIVLLLCAEKILPQPMLYLSAYFEQHRSEYYHLLLGVSTHGQWREWISFFLRGLATQSKDAILRADKLLGLWHNYRRQVQSFRSSALLLVLIDVLFRQPYLTFSQAAKLLNVTFRSAQLNVHKLVDANILQELPGRKYGRIFLAAKIVEILES